MIFKVISSVNRFICGKGIFSCTFAAGFLNNMVFVSIDQILGLSVDRNIVFSSS